MASLVRVVFAKVANPNQGMKIGTCAFIQKRNISGNALRASLPAPPKKPAPFDYENNEYGLIRSLFDRTTHRFDENTKVIVVEGPVASGKTEFAKALACELGMKHYVEPNMDYHYLQPNGVDLRIFDKDLPEDAKTYDHVNFNLNPKHRNAANYQIMMYSGRYSQYLDALTHLLNTGEGVVLERSPFSDYIFLEAMYKAGYISKGARSVYYDVKANTIEELLRPHLVIYLDISVDTVCKFIKKRNHQHEVNSKAMTKEYLTEIERLYKDRYLPDISTHAELLVYDWSGGGDVDVVVEDIERLNFDKFTEREDPKMKDWRLPREVDWADLRMKYTNDKAILMNQFNVPRFDVPELILSADDNYARYMALYNHPKFDYLHTYLGGGNLLKNSKPKNLEWI